MTTLTRLLISTQPGLMIWTVVCFLIAVAFLKRYALPPLLALADERQRRIQQSLAEADWAVQEAEELRSRSLAQLTQAQQERQQIIADAEQRKQALLNTSLLTGARERARRRATVDAEIASLQGEAVLHLRQRVSELVCAGTAQALPTMLTTADDQRLLEDALAGLDLSKLDDADAWQAGQ